MLSVSAAVMVQLKFGVSSGLWRGYCSLTWKRLQYGKPILGFCLDYQLNTKSQSEGAYSFSSLEQQQIRYDKI
jgi:hypothetical protein